MLPHSPRYSAPPAPPVLDPLRRLVKGRVAWREGQGVCMWWWAGADEQSLVRHKANIVLIVRFPRCCVKKRAPLSVCC